MSGGIYAFFFCVFPSLMCVFPSFMLTPNTTLINLSLWGSIYIMFASGTAQLTSSAVFRIIEKQIAPRLSPQTSNDIVRELDRRFSKRRILVVSSSLALIFVIVSAVLLSKDLPTASTLEIIWWSFGFFILYFLAAQVTDVARFYGVFAGNIAKDPKSLYPLDPRKSPVIVQIRQIGYRILLFWLGILSSVLTLLFFVEEVPMFLKFTVPVASVFSMLFGTLVFLKSEYDLWQVVNDVTIATQENLQMDIRGLLARRNELQTSEWERLSRLTTLHQDLPTSSSLISAIPSVLSMVAPFVGPIVTFS
ncbi:MAG: hypothetical protein ACREX4_24075 [Gammaproteobacteria bacterium]